jgi:hypothetical protein
VKKDDIPVRNQGKPADLDLSDPKRVVFLVYNGADFVDVKEIFQSDMFTCVCVHLPIEVCVKWELSVTLQRTSENLQRCSLLLAANGIDPVAVLEPEDAEMEAPEETGTAASTNDSV